MIILTTDQFWDKMCDARAVRLDANRLAIGRKVYWCFRPPERDPLFLTTKITDIADKLGG